MFTKKQWSVSFCHLKFFKPYIARKRMGNSVPTFWYPLLDSASLTLIKFFASSTSLYLQGIYCVKASKYDRMQWMSIACTCNTKSQLWSNDCPETKIKWIDSELFVTTDTNQFHLIVIPNNYSYALLVPCNSNRTKRWTCWAGRFISPIVQIDHL